MQWLSSRVTDSKSVMAASPWSTSNFYALSESTN
ncbi:unnamed protein product [Rhodiola kirilowii]